MGAVILENLTRPQTVSSLWETIRNTSAGKNFEKFIITLDFLYIIGLVEIRDGLISKKSK